MTCGTSRFCNICTEFLRDATVLISSSRARPIPSGGPPTDSLGLIVVHETNKTDGDLYIFRGHYFARHEVKPVSRASQLRAHRSNIVRIGFKINIRDAWPVQLRKLIPFNCRLLLYLFLFFLFNIK